MPKKDKLKERVLEFLLYSAIAFVAICTILGILNKLNRININ